MLTLLLILLPIILGLAIVIAGPTMARKIALGGSLAGLAVTITAIVQYNYGMTALLSFYEPWMQSLGIHFSFILDGISLVMMLLTYITAPLIIFATKESEIKNPHIFYSLVLLMIGGMSGCFASADAFLFYLFYELSLVPIFFIAHVWGKAENKAAITIKFFLYTLFGSLFMLLSLIYVYLQTPDQSFAFDALYQAGKMMSSTEQGLVFGGIFIAFAVKMPVFPFHTWQPSTYQMAPTAGTMLLAAIMLKMATYGLIRMVLPMVPDGLNDYGIWAVVLSVISVVYASCMALVQKNYKLLIAYSSIAHVGIISAGVLSGNEQGIQGGLVEMLSHGILAVGMFYVYDIITSRIKTDEMKSISGIRHENSLFAFLFFIMVMGSVALPFTSGFVGEFLLLLGLGQYNMVLTGIAGLSVILGAVYMLRAFQQMFLGVPNALTTGFAPLTSKEKIILITIVVLVIGIGIYPKPILDLTQGAVIELLTK
ncbi:MAG: NADH-quinone oxidoreductase subunit M [Flavobacteriales bacterium]|nr:NADH-quinone oxidoreductase subunit M [Flavobacteriales bacterium]